MTASPCRWPGGPGCWDAPHPPCDPCATWQVTWLAGQKPAKHVSFGDEMQGFTRKIEGWTSKLGSHQRKLKVEAKRTVISSATMYWCCPQSMVLVLMLWKICKGPCIYNRVARNLLVHHVLHLTFNCLWHLVAIHSGHPPCLDKCVFIIYSSVTSLVLMIEPRLD